MIRKNQDMSLLGTKEKRKLFRKRTTGTTRHPFAAVSTPTQAGMRDAPSFRRVTDDMVLSLSQFTAS